MLAKAVQLSFSPDAEPFGNGATDVDGDALADEGPEYDVVRNEDEVKITFPVPGVAVRGVGETMGDEDEGREGVREVLADVWCQKLPIGP